MGRNWPQRSIELQGVTHWQGGFEGVGIGVGHTGGLQDGGLSSQAASLSLAIVGRGLSSASHKSWAA